MHTTAAADRQHALAVQRPGQVAAVALCTAGTAVHDACRQRRGRQERRDHQHREHKAQKSFSHTENQQRRPHGDKLSERMYRGNLIGKDGLPDGLRLWRVAGDKREARRA